MTSDTIRVRRSLPLSMCLYIYIDNCTYITYTDIVGILQATAVGLDIFTRRPSTAHVTVTTIRG